MSPEWLTAIGTLGTFVVIAASAIAALLQLRHMRGGNQIVALTECREKLESEEFQNARRFIVAELPKLLQDPEKRLKLQTSPSAPLEFQQATNIANFFESMGGFVRFGIIDRKIACTLWCGVVVSSWNNLLPMIRLRRKTTPAVWEYFEYLAAISKQFMEENPTSYPSGVPRMPLGDDSDVA
ncbi:MAG TPA: hypothetical protein VFO29_00755 [Candidatus Rubrimentiphilum sp.]|nr:hypothetical protein [Candidatus Rubrimentiphilum sp.]